MLMVSVFSVLIFSLMGAALLVSDLSRKRAVAFADSSSSFYSAESGLNRRADKLRQQFLGFIQPTGTMPLSMANCITSTGDTGSGDFGCETDTFDSSEPFLRQQGNSTIDSSSVKSYLAYTYVQSNTPTAILRVIPTGELYAGLTALEYSYRVFSTAIRRSNSADLNSTQEAQTILQMDFNSRIIPLFQFAAFYNDDMEINPGADMTLGGRVHTNGNLRLSPGGSITLNFVGPVTAGKDIYNSIGFAYPDATAINGFTKFIDGAGNPVNNASGNQLQFQSPSSLNYVGPALTASELLPFNNVMQSKATQLEVPTPNFIRKVDPTQPGSIGEYYGKADLQLEFLPTQAVPFKLTAIKTGMTPGGCTGVVTSEDRKGGPFQCSVLTEGQLRSLQQPVLVQTEAGTQQANFFCPTLASVVPPTVAAIRRPQVVRALAAAIAAQSTPLTYSSITSNLNTLTAIQTSFSTNLDGISGLTEKAALLDSTPAQIAAVNAGCLIPAPIQSIRNSFRDQREGRTIDLLQVNIRSLTAWNYYNISVDWSSGTVNNTYSGQGTNTDELLFQRDVLNGSAPAGSFQSLAAGSGGKSFGAVDRFEGGLVLYGTIDKTVYPYPNAQSPYAFAIAQGSTLPSPLTFATDQAVYLQGDYNNVNKQPAAVMADTITVLSNTCWDNTNGIKGAIGTTNECGQAIFGNKGTATETTINAAFLAGTDRSDPTATPARYSGGLNNMMRFHELWTGINFNYTGSLVSLGTPQEYSGRLLASGTSNYKPPIRNWNYDVSFNQFSLLPPLSPRVIYLKQQLFGRRY
jgi:hypothetical protein